ncbi:hypothetical protein AX15_001893 [Amanita polypyramis BW_CC]|nr:hypothetical protein AX15_001893 [Amanita polypyramis BW_CC]
MLPDPQQTYGLDYSHSFLSSLPLAPRNSHVKHSPVRLLSAKSFGDLHLQHILSHPPDNVLFPFLHGLEGDNHAQNAFFHSSAIGAPIKSYGSPATVNANYAAKVPRYRGLVWVVCEEDLQLDGNDAALCILRRRPTSESESENGSEESSETSSSFDDEDEDSDEDLNARYTPVVVSDNDMHLDGEDGSQVIAVEQKDGLSEDKHMHPIQHRPTIKTSGLTPTQPISISTMSAVSDGSTSLSSSISGASYFGSSSPSTATSVDSVDYPLQSEVSSDSLSPALTSKPPEPSYQSTEVTQSPSNDIEPNTVPALPTPGSQVNTYFSPALLTATFRPRELLRKVDARDKDCRNKIKADRKDTENLTRSDSDSESSESTNEWDFVPAQVPEGISLRNFAIQVPIYATLSDIVIYSPKGPTKRALALAERFRTAADRKRKERIQKQVAARLAASQEAAQGTGRQPGIPFLPSFYSDDATAAVSTSKQGDGQCCEENSSEAVSLAARIEQELDNSLLHYNVFVLSANEEEMRREIPHLMMRIAINPESSVSAGWEARDIPGGSIPLGGGAHTDRTDGHLVEQGNEMVPEADARATSSQMGDIGIDLNMDMGMDVDATSGQTENRPAQVIDDLESDNVPNTVDFAQREKDEMRDLTRASDIISCFPDDLEADQSHDLSGTRTATHWNPLVGQVFLGNASDVPFIAEQPVRLTRVPQANEQPTGADNAMEAKDVDSETRDNEGCPFNYRSSNNPGSGYGYDICIECHDLAPFPSAAHLRAAEQHLVTLEKAWEKRCRSKLDMKSLPQGIAEEHGGFVLPPRPPPNANTVIHLPCPSSPPNTQSTMASLMPLIKFLEKSIRPMEMPPSLSGSEAGRVSTLAKRDSSPSSGSSRRWSSAGSPSSLLSGIAYAANAVRTRSFTTPDLSSSYSANQLQDTRSRPLKVLVYSSDGYTESSVLALCLLMAARGLSLPEAYLELQTVKGRSFFVYQGDLGLLKRVDSRLQEEREREVMQRQVRERGQRKLDGDRDMWLMSGTHGWGMGWYMNDMAAASIRYATGSSAPHYGHNHHGGRPAAKSVSSAQSPLEQYQQHPSSIDVSTAGKSATAPSMYMGSPCSTQLSDLAPSDTLRPTGKGRPRASTSPWVPSLFGDHHSWFNDPRFDGSFPSRVLPFLYLGNLNHAMNAYMLHALGITHVVSVGECALVPPAQVNACNVQGPRPGPSTHYVTGRGPGVHGSLWTEEKEGRIKVLDIKGVCDDGIDTLEPQLEPICDWIDKGRQEGGKVLVHCRVGVSRSATVTIAYVMKHLGISLVDAYLVVRSRRLSVLIQPNMRLLYNLCGWEIKLAKERAQGDEQKLRRALARTLIWPYLAKEVHTLNEKYLH